jgi:hypothetical protein
MSVTTSFGTQLLALVLEAAAIANIADNAASSPLVSLYISLHTASPGIAGSQNTSETAYTGYARVAVARSAAGWTSALSAAANDGAIDFAICTAAPGAAITHIGIGTASSGAGSLLFFGALNSSISMQVGATPSIPIGDLDLVCS